MVLRVRRPWIGGMGFMGDFLQDIREYFPRRIVALLAVSTVSGFLEGMSLFLLYPFLSLLIDGRLPDEGRIIPVVVGAWRQVAGEPTVISLGVLILIVTIFQYGTRILQNWLSGLLLGIYVSSLRRSLFSALLRAKWFFFVNAQSGELVNSLTLETTRCLYVLQMFAQLVSSVLNALIFIALAAMISAYGTGALMGMAIVIGAICQRYIRRSNVVGRNLTNLNELFSGWTSDILANMKFFKATGSEAVALARCDDIITDMRMSFVWMYFGPQLVRSIVEFVAVVMFLVFLVFGIKVLNLDMAAMLVIIGIFVRLLPRLAVALESVQSLALYLPTVVKVRSLRRRAAEEAEAEAETVAAAPGEGRSGPVGLEVRDLTVRYGARLVLDGVSLEIPAGSFTTIVGGSGAGKTTLIDSLLGLIDVDGGEIRVDGAPLTRERLGVWRRSVGYQGQDTMILNGSLRDNIVWAEADPSDAQIAEAARKAGIDGFIASLPEGYASPTGERGCKLSGGQRQRIGLARAMLSHKRLLILDEATSALDSATEREVVENIKRLKGEITIVMITHRLSTARQADRIYVLDEGRLVQHGRWEELITTDGAFQALWQQQMGHHQA